MNDKTLALIRKSMIFCGVTHDRVAFGEIVMPETIARKIEEHEDKLSTAFALEHMRRHNHDIETGVFTEADGEALREDWNAFMLEEEMRRQNPPDLFDMLNDV